ncbi:MAG: hypothetical protein KKA65_01235 [Nanoarchaeota archaeon]|nr:hypothetical protein [Nanoarchaeota archaeon]MBU4241843.1 hypothetical protein [Nanoarchaeota archaeon]MBU4351882.1 hypothetical protein [Nanoarchaeota archaeon]MBU4456103.1 hypothetical protein [Nanoarchaeota archaeon]MCG2719755.1 hypothetical protein [Nanoarchaeota archaeon]
MYSDLVQFEGEKLELGFDNVYNAKNLKIVECDEFTLQQTLENKKSEIIVIHEKSPKDHLHFRRTALNQVTCKLAKKNKIIIAFSFDKIINSRDKALVFGRLMQNFKLCRKYKVKVLFASFARNKYGMRSSHDLLSLLQVLGMTADEANKALSVVKEIVNKNPEVAKGVKIVKNGKNKNYC